MPEPPAPSEGQNAAQGNAPASQQQARKALLRQNEKEFRDGVERLYQLSSDLRDEVQKTLTTDVLSVRMYKKTEEIEKLAKQLKSRARG
jgi:heme oxygenase